VRIVDVGDVQPPHFGKYSIHVTMKHMRCPNAVCAQDYAPQHTFESVAAALKALSRTTDDVFNRIEVRVSRPACDGVRYESTVVAAVGSDDN
jgi:hypothetical protein